MDDSKKEEHAGVWIGDDRQWLALGEGGHTYLGGVVGY
jgi:hypothetical protein